jgi:hypothetical protein
MEGIKAGVSLPPLPLIFFIFNFSSSLEGGVILSPNLFHLSLSFFPKAEMICNSTKEFEVLLLKDRFTKDNHTSSGWADALLNGRFPGLNTHVVEIQLHHDKLVSIREDMGGHYLYSIFRSLVEALEVVFGNEEAQKKIAKHAPRLVDGSIIDQLQAEIHANKI